MFKDCSGNYTDTPNTDTPTNIKLCSMVKEVSGMIYVIAYSIHYTLLCGNPDKIITTKACKLRPNMSETNQL